jgi:hypothetical protein
MKIVDYTIPLLMTMLAHGLRGVSNVDAVTDRLGAPRLMPFDIFL